MVYLESNQISNGSKIDLSARSINVGFHTILGQGDIPMKLSTLSASNKIHRVDYLGINNPTYNVMGEFDKTRTTNKVGSVVISVGHIRSHLLLGSPVWLIDPDITYIPAGSANVMLSDWALSKRAIEGSTVSYTANFIETKAW